MGVYAQRRMRERQRAQEIARIETEREAAAQAASAERESDEELMARAANHRRYLRFKAELAAQFDPELADTWAARLAQEAPGTPLPDLFPAADELAAHTLPYRCLEDLAGADEAELTRVKGVGRATAKKILEALSAD